MSGWKGKSLTQREAARLGGFAAADLLNKEQRQERARLGGNAVLEQRGRAFYLRMALRRWGRHVELNEPNSRFKKSVEMGTDSRSVRRRAAEEAREDRAWARDFILRGTIRGVPGVRPSVAKRLKEKEQSNGDRTS